MKIRKRILAAVLTAIMTISMLPANTFATETVGNEEAESAVEAVSVSTEEQDVETTVEDVSEDLTEETSIEPSETDEVEETADPAAEETIETVEETVESTEEAEAAEPAAAEPAAEPAVEEVEATDTVDWPVTLEVKGKDYVVAVTYDAEAGIPADAKVEIEEILANDKAYDEYVEQAADKIDADVENLSYVRLFDISLVGADGDKLEPTGPVGVKIRLKDVEKADETTQVVHFAGEKEIPEIIDTEIKGKDISFETDGFSIYAVVVDDEHSSEDRLEVTFNLNGGSINGSEENIVILVKPDDITDNGGNEFNKIVYDPGMPEAAGKKFMGWTTEQNYTDTTTPMSFDEVREDIQDKLASVKEGDTATYYAMMFNAFELYYVNENNVLFNTVSLLSTADSVTTEVKQEYSVSGSATEGFIGWVEQGTDEPVYAVGQSITITTAKPQVVLTPKLGPGKWLYFDGNDGGSTAADTASYTPPAFIPQDTPATAYEPADPTRLGYKFDGWYTEAEGGEKFVFSQTLTEDKTVYAHWIPNPEAQYKVIIWAQSVDDNWDAADADKTYDYVSSSDPFTVATGTQITEDLLRQGGFLSKTDADFGATDLEHGSKAFQYRTFEVVNGVGAGEDEVSAMGDTIVNVYYDRKLMTIEFAGAVGGTSQTYYEPVDEVSGTTAYGFVDGQYVPLTVTADRYIEWYRSATATSTTLVGELETVYYGTSATSSYDTANINIASAIIGTNAGAGSSGNPGVYYRGYSGNPNTLSTSSNASPLSRL